MTAAWMTAFQADLERITRSSSDHDTPGIAIGVLNHAEATVWGHSYADREARIGVNPRDTLFRAGSLSRLMTALAILQLTERGKLRLHEPIAKYLPDLPIAPSGEDAITAAHLITATDGLPDRLSHALTLTAQDRPLKQVLQTHVGSLVARPGKLITADSWGVPLAAYLVEAASGMPYADYIQSNIFNPLGMTHSVIASNGSEPRFDGYRVAPVYYLDRGKMVRSELIRSAAPAVDEFYTTAEDMLTLARALLEIASGANRGSGMLQEEAIDGMFIRRFSNHVSLPGVTYGFHQISYDNVTGLAADGTGTNIRARLILMPGSDSALIMLINAPADLIIEQISRSFLSNAAENSSSAVKPFTPPANFHYRGDRFAGAYRYQHHEVRGAAKAYALFRGNVWLINNFDGTLTVVPQVDGDLPGGFIDPVKLTLVDDSVENALVFQRADTGGRIAFTENPNGLITAMHAGAGNQATYQRVGLVDSSTFYLVIAAVCLAIFASGVLLWTFGVAINLASGSGSSWLLGTLGAVVSILNFGWVAAVLPVFREQRSGLPRLMFPNDFAGWRRAALNIPPINAVLIVGLIIGTLLAYQNDYWTELARLHYLLLTLCAIAFTLIQIRWSLFQARDWYVHEPENG